ESPGPLGSRCLIVVRRIFLRAGSARMMFRSTRNFHSGFARFSAGSRPHADISEFVVPSRLLGGSEDPEALGSAPHQPRSPRYRRAPTGCPRPQIAIKAL